MSLFGVGLAIEVKRINTQYKIFIQKRGGQGLRDLISIFNKFNKTLNHKDFEAALNEYG